MSNLAEDTGPGAINTPARAKRRIALLIAGGAGLLTVGGLLASMFVISPEQQRAEARPPGRTVLTSAIEQRVLASTVVTRGLVGAARRVQVTPVSAQGASITVVTAIHTRVGSSIQAGDVIVTVSGRPLLALPGPVPAYRDLRPADEGADVAQLQAALRTLGFYSGGDAVGRFGPATKSAVKSMYSKAGYAVPDTGGPGGRGDKAALRAADDAVLAAQRLVASLEGLIAADPTATPSPGEASLAEQLATARTALNRAAKDRADLIASTGPMVPLAEVVFLPAFPAIVEQLSAKLGEAVVAPLITLATGAFSVAARLQADQAPLIKGGMKVSIVSEAKGLTAEGVVESVGELTVDKGEGGPSGAPYFPMTVVPKADLPQDWNGLDVRLTVTAAQTSSEVLVVPVAAISASADGRTTVSVANPDGSQTTVEVRPGVSANGYVEIIPVGVSLQEGDRVVIGQ
ncbi:peptidoglycan-binding protein [Allorhizocola rhizosphaerae]|uniref:peptidoglycan-binding protein n=1 Tax=Allorhizocola rhizosphaerae TaxID=1872709 RepID=UPI0013C2B4B4|nr:peptidoglycan-binding protein [Allorhizocola rhizosphaerae]